VAKKVMNMVIAFESVKLLEYRIERCSFGSVVFCRSSSPDRIARVVG
jgi:hypothetical protein